MQTDRLCVWQICLRVSRCWVARLEEVILHWLSRRGETHRETVKIITHRWRSTSKSCWVCSTARWVKCNRSRLCLWFQQAHLGMFQKCPRSSSPLCSIKNTQLVYFCQREHQAARGRLSQTESHRKPGRHLPVQNPQRVSLLKIDTKQRG